MARIYICDKCQKQNSSKSSVNEVVIDVEQGSDEIRVDLCSSCVGRLKRWLTDPDPQAA